MKTKRVCERGHTYYKSSDCPTCPTCEVERKPEDGFLALFAAPARRALESAHITRVEDLTAYSAAEMHDLHGIGRKALDMMRQELKRTGLSFRDEK